jgi:CheY-like chemotaxis protein
MERLFEPFFTTKGQGRGTGLGLATVHGIVMQSGGQIVVNSTPGVGTEFAVYLPAYSGTAPVRRATPSAGTPQSAVGVRTVLVVDDDDAVREVAVRALARVGYRVLAVAGGDAALALLAKQDEYDTMLVLTDVLMPGMGGPQLAARIAATRPQLPVIFMSGYPGDSVQWLQSGNSSRPLIEKLFSADSLTRAVRAALEGQS